MHEQTCRHMAPQAVAGLGLTGWHISFKAGLLKPEHVRFMSGQDQTHAMAALAMASSRAPQPALPCTAGLPRQASTVTQASTAAGRQSQDASTDLQQRGRHQQARRDHVDLN